jgi:3-methyladenine DNA glycosylase/8-oxoguanine DNA glycosylase
VDDSTHVVVALGGDVVVVCNSRGVASALTPSDRARAIVNSDQSFRALVEIVGAPPVRRSAPVADRFGYLARSITYQLLATKAANTIHQRVIDLCDGAVTPDSIAIAGHANLRAVGLSNAKAAAMLDLSARVLDGRLQLARHGRMNDFDVLANVVEVRGVGPWTAQMYLMHTLARHDVWPAGDLGVRAGWTQLHDLEKLVSEVDLKRHGGVFEGFRSDVAWYCWQAVHLSRSK